MSNFNEYIMPYLDLAERRFLLSYFLYLESVTEQNGRTAREIAKNINHGFLETEKMLDTICKKLNSTGGTYILYRGLKLKPEYEGKDLTQTKYCRNSDNRIIREVNIIPENIAYDVVYSVLDKEFIFFVLDEHKNGKWLSTSQDIVP